MKLVNFFIFIFLLNINNIYSSDLNFENNLNQLVDMKEIRYIELISPPSEDKLINSREIVGVNTVHSSSYNLSGNGINILQYEGNIPGDNEDIDSRVIVPRFSDYGPKDHATHVAGILIGNGTNNISYKGIAYKSKIIAYETDYWSWEDTYNDTGNIESDYLDGMTNYNTRFSTNSWGVSSQIISENCNFLGDYTLVENLLDTFVKGNLTQSPFPIVWANGNERNDSGNLCDLNYSTTLPQASAKNIISVGATYSSDNSSTSFSSYGPTDANRIKPELVAPGCVNSTDTNNNYSLGCGTSMSAPHVSGTIALMLEQWNLSGYQSSLGDPLPSTIKALLLDSTTDLKQNGDGTQVIDGPDYINGFGLLNAKGAVDRIINGTFKESNLSEENEVDVYAINITNQNSIKVTLAWDDVPNANLVNDLDLKLISPKGKTFYPWTLNPSVPNQTAIRNESDHLNVVEQVYVNSSEISSEGTGQWLVIISSNDLPYEQKYSIVSEININTNYSTMNISDKTTAYYPLDINADDYSNNSYNGIVSSGVTFTSDAHKTNSSVYNGDDYLSVSNFPNLNSNMSISLWFKADNLTTESDLITKSNNNDLSYILGIYGGSPRVLWKTQDSGDWMTITSTWNTNTWYHIILTYDRNDLKVYKNGILVNTFTNYGGDIETSSEPLNIGRRSSSDGKYFNGKIDEVSIWNKTLVPYEVEMIYEKGLNSNKIFTMENISSGLSADNTLMTHYKFENNLNDETSKYSISSSNNLNYVSGYNSSSSSIDLDGSTSYAKSANFTNLTKNMSLSLWFKANSFTTESDIITKSNNNDLSFIFGLYGGSPRVLWKTQDSGDWNTLSGTWNTSVWYHLALVYDRADLKVYKNGILIDTFTNYGGDIETSSEPLNLGRRSSSDGKYFSGKIDDVSMWNRSLNSTEVSKLYEFGIN